MIPLKKYILENSSSFTFIPTNEWMEEKFKEFNRTLFDNKLPYCYLEATKDPSKLKKQYCGLFTLQVDWYYWKDKKHNDRGYKIYFRIGKGSKMAESIDELKPAIYMNTAVKYETEERMESTLIHEMIHLYTFKDCYCPIQCHGKEFKSMCKLLTAKGERIYNKKFVLTTYCDLVDFEYDEETVKKEKEKLKGKTMISMLLEFDENELLKHMSATKVLKNKSRIILCFEEYVNKIVNEVKAEEIKYGLKSIIISRTAFDKSPSLLGKIKTMRKYSGYYYITDLENLYSNILDDENKEILFEKNISEGKIKNFINKVKDLIKMFIKKGTNLSIDNIDDISQIEYHRLDETD